ncbi:MAG: peptidyl-prolyl cis-trans isomerase [Novosphingobium sp.]|nr:peptidyl-prolyl cis-trans isomerase [Novosphingobium sp.]MCB2078623.1 peptidyl-prolyl cis-trans isomerase [Novosphingobium sp.]
MLEALRKMLRSKIGAALAIAVLVLIALAFASGDVASTGGFGGIAGGDRVATVGNERVDTSALNQAASSALERVRQNDPRMTMKVFLNSGGLDQVLADMIDRTAIAAFGKQNGIVAGDRLVDSEITQIAAFKGPDGKFSEDVFRQAIRQQGISEKLVRDDLVKGLVSKQVLLPASFGSVVPRELAKRYAALLRDRRSGAMAVLPAALFAPEEPPSDAELSAYYKANQGNFIRPERRIIRYASFGEEALKDVPAPTEAEIAFRYKEDQAQYAARETRRLTQLIVPTEAAAKAVIAEVNGGTSLETAAKEKGLATAKLDPLGRDELTKQFSAAVADAAFAAGEGKLAAPARSGLGWHIIRVDAVNSRPARTLDQVSGDIAERIASEKKRVALNELLSRIEDQFDEGGSLAEAAKELGVTPEQTQPITADGQVYQKAGERAPDVLTKVLETAFAMDQENPQLAEVEPGKTFVIFDVTDIEPSAAAPLKDIRDDVTAAYTMDKGFAAARKAAEKVQAEVRKGSELGKAMASLGKRLPPVQNINMTREEMARMQMQAQRQVPPPLALFFSMAEGTVKLLAAPQDTGWFVVYLKDIVPGEVKDDEQILATAARELGGVVGNEYIDSMRRAIRAEVGVKRNESAIKAVKTQLGGGS